MMIQWAVDVPEPSAERLRPVCMEVHEAGGFAGFDYCTQVADLDEASKAVRFYLPKFMPHESEVSGVMDACYFYCLFVFQNSTGSRTESIRATPRKVFE